MKKVEFEIKEIEPESSKRFRVKISYLDNGKYKEKVFSFLNKDLKEDNFLAKIQAFFEEQNETINDKLKKFKGKKFEYILKS